MRFGANADLIDNKDYPSLFTLKGEQAQARGGYKYQAMFDVQTPDFSGAEFASKFEVEHNDKSEWLLKNNTSMTYDGQYSVGYHAMYNAGEKGQGLRQLRAQAVCSPKDSDSTFWLRMDHMRKFAGAGCDNKLKDGIQHSWEGLYIWRDNFTGIGGQPVKLLGGVQYALGKTSNLKVQAEVGKDYTIKSGVTHKIDDHWTMGVNQRFVSANLADEAKKAKPYDIGLEMTYKL